MIYANSKKIRLLVLSFVFQAALFAQEAVTSAGGNAAGTGGSVSYTAGQVFYSTNTGSGGSTTEGVQQPFEIWVVTELPEAKEITLFCTVYPNPVTDKLILKFEQESPVNYFASLYDIQGRLIQKLEVTGSETGIDMIKLVIGSYFLKVSYHDKEIKSFKIIKN